MATPISGNVGKPFKAMRDAVVDLLLVGIRLVVRLANTFRDNFGVALSVAGILAVGTLHSSSVFQEIAAKRATHDVVELLRDELVTLLLVYFLLPLSDRTLTVETDVERSSVLRVLGWTAC
jgi:hypothetical protein